MALVQMLPCCNVDSREPHIAIIGGGIVGVILTLGLLRQNVSVRLYEQSDGFRGIGAGIAFSAAARRCMELTDPAVLIALKRCGAVPVSDKADDEDDHLRWIDGYNQHCDKDLTYQKPLAKISGSGFHGCRRDQFLEELAKEVPPGVIVFNKRLEDMRREKDGKIHLHFADCSSAQVDAVIGSDGIKSRVRQCLFGADHPASHPQYTHKVAYRGLVPMQHAVKVLGPWKAKNFHHHIGPGAHLTHYPVADHTMLNVVVFLSDPTQWHDAAVMVESGTRSEVKTALQGWHPTVLGVVELLPTELSKWALFDQGEFPLPKYNVERACVAGDAAHASSPHHGAGACLGVEDALCLSKLLGHVQTYANREPSTNALLEAAFATFDKVRRPRTQWLVNSSRRVCDLYHQQEWADPKRWVKAETCFEELRDRSYKIWHFDADGMVKQTENEFHRAVTGANFRLHRTE